MASSERRAAETATVEPLAGDRHELLLFAPGTRLAERYEIREVLGQGGFAVVYRAFDHQLRQEIALKVLRAERLSETGLRRLQREAAVARDAASPHLLRIFDIGTAGSAVFLTLELAPGGSLRERLADGPLPIAEAVRITRGILEGLADLHARGVVHRDVKPGNVLFDAAGEVKLADFGLALRLDRDETRATASQALIGTVEYLSPEQILGEEATAQSDLYAVGVVLFEMLTGRLPRSGASSLGTLLAHLKDPVPDPRVLRRDIPPWLGGLLLGLLDRSPAGRPASARAVLAAFDARQGALAWMRHAWGRRALVAATVLLTVTAGASWYAASRPRFDHLVELGGGRLQAVDRAGRALWSREDVGALNHTAVARVGAGGARRLVTLSALRPDSTQTAAERRTLSILDLDTGAELDRVELPSAAGTFPGYADTYSPRVGVVDLEDDGVDEVVVSFLHRPFWPSYAVLYRPLLRQALVVLVAGGHHVFAGATDVDGDGRRELIFVGLNNQLGWFTSVAAVRVPGGDAGPGLFPTVTPGLSMVGGETPAWYALGPHLWPSASRASVVDPVSGAVRLELSDGSSYLLDRAGFARPGQRPEADRQRLRGVAWAALRRASDARANADPARALRELTVGGEAAAQAEEPLLVEVMALRRALETLQLGDLPTARRELETLWRQAVAPTEVAYQAANAFHLLGAHDLAADWYRHGLQDPGVRVGGRGPLESMEGLVLLEAEHGRAREARAELARRGFSFQGVNDLLALGVFLDWRLGLPISLTQARTVITSEASDLYRYWLLEARLAAGEAPAPLLGETERELAAASEKASGLLTSLRAELLGGLGRRDEAMTAARAACDGLEGRLDDDTWARGHVDLALARWQRLARGDREQTAAAAALARRLADRRERERALAARARP